METNKQKNISEQFLGQKEYQGNFRISKLLIKVIKREIPTRSQQDGNEGEPVSEKRSERGVFGCVWCVWMSKGQLGLAGVSGAGGSNSPGQGAPATSTVTPRPGQ